MFLTIRHALLLGTLLLPTSSAFATPDVPVRPHGVVSDAGWALARLNNGASEVSTVSYVYPETTNPVRLYLIDTAVDNSSGWFDHNPSDPLSYNLQSLSTTLIRGANDPTTSSAFKHGSQMLSIIAGAAIGTPLEVINYDVYPNSISSIGLLIAAVGEAIAHQEANPGTPAIICIANGSGVPHSDAFLESEIADAVALGMTVIVSAGNESTEASLYVPAAYGTQAGVICVGASNKSNLHYALSNSGSAVDIYAPGEDVDSFDPAQYALGQSVLMSGTSPAAALATAAAIANLSQDPGLTPAQLENRLKTNAFSSSVSLIQLPPESDSDHDGTADILELFFGTDHMDPSDWPSTPALGRSGNTTTLSFSISSALFDVAQPKVLNNGSTWIVRCSTDLKTWTEAIGTFEYGTAVDGKTPVTFTGPESATSCFYQLGIYPAP